MCVSSDVKRPSREVRRERSNVKRPSREVRRQAPEPDEAVGRRAKEGEGKKGISKVALIKTRLFEKPPKARGKAKRQR